MYLEVSWTSYGNNETFIYKYMKNECCYEKQQFTYS